MGQISKKTIARVESTREELNSIPWWRFLKRQDAGRRYRWALFDAACEELENT